MNGSGATINFDNSSYNVDATKLSTVRNDFVSYLGKIAGSGNKVVVNGVEYGISSDKIAGAVSELELVLGDLVSGDGSDSGDMQVVFEEQTLEGFYLNTTEGLGYMLQISPAPFVLSVGETYRVKWDDKEYTCKAQDISALFGTGAVGIGDMSMAGGVSNGEIFAIGYANGFATFFAMMDSSISHTVAIYKANSNDSNGLVKNEYGFYFDVPYVSYLEYDGNILTYACKFFADGSGYLVVYQNGELVQENTTTAGTFVYELNKIYEHNPDYPDGYLVTIVKDNGTKLISDSGEVFILDTSASLPDDSGNNSDILPFVFNTKNISEENTKVFLNPEESFIKLSSTPLSLDVLEQLSICFIYNNRYNNLLFDHTLYDELGKDIIYAIYEDEIGESGYAIVSVFKPGNYAGIEIQEAGLYVADIYTTFGLDTDMRIDYASNSGERHDNAIPEGAYYANLATGTFYSEMPETCSDGDAYLYGDYVYLYSSAENGWSANLARVDTGIQNYIPNYPLVDEESTTFGLILEGINNKHVVTIHSQSFMNCHNLTSVVIPNNVTYIGDYAFWHCENLRNIVIPSSVTRIGEYAFDNCQSLKYVTLPDNLKYIERDAFQFSGLEQIHIPHNTITYISDYTFRGCHNLTDVVIPKSVTYIGNQAFESCSNLTDIIFYGTMEEWINISKHNNWNGYNEKIPAKFVKCRDGNVTI